MATNGDKVAENGGENTKKIVDLNTTELDRIDIVDGGLSSESVDVFGEKKDGGESTVIGSDSADDIQEKILALKAAVNGSGGVKKVGEAKKAEELKRKARADRFGVPASTTTVVKRRKRRRRKLCLNFLGKILKLRLRLIQLKRINVKLGH